MNINEKMKIDVFAVCYNEEIILPYFLRHYKQFARNITVYDNMSTDRSVEIMKEANVNIIPFDTNNEFQERVLINIRNNCWRESDADWIIVCDIAEFIYHPNLINTLENANGTYITTEGYEMMSENLPTTNGQIYDELKIGHLSHSYSKPCLFKIKDITDINFGCGNHTAKPIGKVIEVKGHGIKMLHYKYINRKVLIDKHAHYKIRQSQDMIAMGWCLCYQEWTPDVLNKQFDDWLAISKNIIDV